MADAFVKLPTGTSRFMRYTSDKNLAGPTDLAPPSQNVLITADGKAETRLGYLEEFSIGVDGSAATAFYHKTYDVAFFALGTKLYYRDFITAQTYDTGLTLTDGTTTRFSEFNGDVYCTNTTDGIVRIMVTRVNGAVSAGAASITVDVDGAARLSVFGDTTGNIRINGVNEAFNAVAVSTGVLTLVGTASQAYADNEIAIFVDNSYSSLEKPSKIEFWKSRMHIMGFPSATNADQPNNTVMAGQFVIGQTGASGIELIVDFTYGTGGSTKITVGTGGKVTNILGVDDTFYFFNEDKVQNAASSDITTSGSAIGLTIPDVKDRNHGCLNEDSATSMGNGEIGYITTDRRIMRLRISTDTGAAVSYADESFDVDIRDHLKDMDKDQTGALAFHYNGQRKTIFQVKENSQWVWHIYDHNVQRQVGNQVYQGAWQPPMNITPVKSLFERNGVLYGTDPSDDSVYSFFTTFTDNLSPILATFATGEFNVGNAMMEHAELEGDINQACEINIRCYVTNEGAGRRSGSAKVVDGADYTYSPDKSVGALSVGDGIQGESTEVAGWKKGFDIYPSEGTKAQLIAENEAEGGFFSVTSYSLLGKQYQKPFSSAL